MLEPRWWIWDTAWSIFLEYPLLGVGWAGFNPAYLQLDLDPGYHLGITRELPHPHNIYLQWLAESGIVGGALLAGLLGTIAGRSWCWLRIRHRPGWELTLGMATCYVAYLVNAMAAHSYFRTWWLGIAMTIMGMLLAATQKGMWTDAEPSTDHKEQP